MKKRIGKGEKKMYSKIFLSHNSFDKKEKEKINDRNIIRCNYR